MTYNRPSDQYFENQVFTATPQRLRLMLIDGALQYAHRAAIHWEQGRNYEAGEAIVGCQRIVTELLRGLRADLAPDLVADLAALYNFVFRSLIEAGLKRDPSKLADAVKVLEIDRETWRQVCEQLGSSLETAQHSAPRGAPHFAGQPDAAAGGFTVEA
ncbi:MAG TPA: flagellar export chaperone FliS [Pirellulales bacterium]|jgi:flagellar protein FliS|nr:flagellar export chaperone FliS [Pirellulales bacterium]